MVAINMRLQQAPQHSESHTTLIIIVQGDGKKQIVKHASKLTGLVLSAQDHHLK